MAQALAKAGVISEAKAQSISNKMLQRDIRLHKIDRQIEDLEKERAMFIDRNPLPADLNVMSAEAIDYSLITSRIEELDARIVEHRRLRKEVADSF